MKTLLCLLSILALPFVSTAQLEWRVSVKLFTGAGGALPQDPGWGGGNINQSISNNVIYVNQLLQTFGRGYQWRLTEIVNVAGTTAPLPASTNSWYNVFVSAASQDDLDGKAKGNAGGFAYRNNAINFYFVNATGGPNGGYCSFPTENQDVILVAPDSFRDVLIHESGHYFGLNHTHNSQSFQNVGGSACASNNPCTCAIALGGDDGIADTPLDNQCWTQNQVAQNVFGAAYNLLNSGQQYFVDNTWSNIMSYHSPGNRFTSDQLDVMTDISNGARFGVASGRTRFVSTTGNDANAGSSTSRYRTVLRGVTVAAPGDIVLLQGGSYNEPRTYNQPVTLRATRGDATIGRP